MPTGDALPAHTALLDPERVRAWLERENDNLKAEYLRLRLVDMPEDRDYVMIRLNGKGAMIRAIAEALQAGEFDLAVAGRRLHWSKP